MSNPFKTADFKRLQMEWYNKINSDGFEDIEDTKDPFMNLKHNSLCYTGKHTLESYYEHMEYYLIATHSIHTHCFDSDCEKDIWILHADGYRQREIASTLGLKLWLVHKTIRKISKILVKKVSNE